MLHLKGAIEVLEGSIDISDDNEALKTYVQMLSRFVAIKQENGADRDLGIALQNRLTVCSQKILRKEIKKLLVEIEKGIESFDTNNNLNTTILSLITNAAQLTSLPSLPNDKALFSDIFNRLAICSEALSAIRNSGNANQFFYSMMLDAARFYFQSLEEKIFSVSLYLVVVNSLLIEKNSDCLSLSVFLVNKLFTNFYPQMQKSNQSISADIKTESYKQVRESLITTAERFQELNELSSSAVFLLRLADVFVSSVKRNTSLIRHSSSGELSFKILQQKLLQIEIDSSIEKITLNFDKLEDLDLSNTVVSIFNNAAQLKYSEANREWTENKLNALLNLKKLIKTNSVLDAHLVWCAGVYLIAPEKTFCYLKDYFYFANIALFSQTPQEVILGYQLVDNIFSRINGVNFIEKDLQQRKEIVDSIKEILRRFKQQKISREINPQEIRVISLLKKIRKDLCIPENTKVLTSKRVLLSIFSPPAQSDRSSSVPPQPAQKRLKRSSSA